MGAEVDATQFSREDRKRHREKVRRGLDALARMLTASHFDFERPMTGLEIELNLVDPDMEPAMRNAALQSRADCGRAAPSRASAQSIARHSASACVPALSMAGGIASPRRRAGAGTGGLP